MQNSKEEKINGISLHIGYNFDNPQLIHNALTRRSAIIENTLDAFHSSNLRLEFIGDTLLNFIIGEIVYDTFQSGNESDLTAYRAGILATDTLGEFLIQKDIGKFMIVGRGEEQNLITRNKKALVELIKAVFGAIYIDTKFNIEITRKIILKFMNPLIEKKFKTYKKGTANYSIKALSDFNNVSDLLREQIELLTK